MGPHNQRVNAEGETDHQGTEPPVTLTIARSPSHDAHDQKRQPDPDRGEVDRI